MLKNVLQARAQNPWYKIFFYFLIIISSVVFVNAVTAGPNSEGIQVYQKNLYPEHKRKLADDIYRYHNADNLWDVLRDEFTLPHYEDNFAVQEKIEWYMNNQDFLLRSASRAAPYLYYILQQVKKRHLPAELVLLPIIESGYNPLALSTAGASGLWQLMPATAADLGVRQDWWYDGRRDVIASTGAALNHLAYLQNFFEGNWLLALAAYDTGEGNVMSAIRKNIRIGRNTDFWSLPVANETKNYVPSLLALAVIISHPDQYPIYFPPVQNAPYLAQVDIGKQINLKYAATLAGLSYKRLMQLNPGYSRASMSTKGPYKLVLPIENVEKFTENLSQSPLNRQIDWIHYRVNAGDTIVSVAKKFNTSVSAIRKLNHLSANSLRRGTNILIPNQQYLAMANSEIANTDESPTKISKIKSEVGKKINAAQVAPKPKPRENYSLMPGDTIYMIRTTDTLEKIATRFHVNPDAVIAINQLNNQPLTPGKQIIIPTHTA